MILNDRVQYQTLVSKRLVEEIDSTTVSTEKTVRVMRLSMGKSLSFRRKSENVVGVGKLSRGGAFGKKQRLLWRPEIEMQVR